MTQERFKQSFKDANELIAIASYFSGRGNKISSFTAAAEWLDMSSETSYIRALTKDNAHSIHIEHVHALMKAKIVASPLMTFIAVMESGSGVTQGLTAANIWVVDSRYALREDRRLRCETALKSIYEILPKHQAALEKLLDAK